MSKYQIIQGNCLEVMPTLADNSIDACITDIPYGTTACSWDSVIPFEPMWKELKRIVKPKGAIVLFGSQPFTSALIMSNLKYFRYELVWNKTRAVGHLNAQVQPMREHENILIFGESGLRYFPQIENKNPNNIRPTLPRKLTDSYGYFDINADRLISADKTFPKTILRFDNCNHSEWCGHPTQKPIKLIQYLIRTYTQENHIVLDFTMGSGTCGVAAAIEKRKFIGIELDEHYFKVAEARIKRANLEPCDIPRRFAEHMELPLFTI